MSPLKRSHKLHSTPDISGGIYSQNFITDPQLVRDLLNRTDISVADIVVEIGAGKGIITQELAKKCNHVLAVEIDDQLIPVLNQRLSAFSNVTVLNTDFLNVSLPTTNYKVFSNLPFNYTSRIMHKLFYGEHLPESAYLIMQKEAADIYLGLPRETQKSLLIKPIYTVEVFHKLRKHDFKPMPDVEIEMIALKKQLQPMLSKKEYLEYKDFIVYATGRSKLTLKLNLNKLFTGEQFFRLSQNLGFSKDVRPLDLSFDQWLRLFRYYQTGVVAEKKQLVHESFGRHLITQSKYKKMYRTRVKR